MDEEKISFLIEGEDAEIAAKEIGEIINEQFGYQPEVKISNGPTETPDKKIIDPVALSALILAIPGTVLTVLDITDRIRKRKKAAEIKKQIQNRVITKREVTVKIIDQKGIVKEFNSVDSIEYLE